MDDHDDMIKEFLVESYENLDQLDRDFVELEKNPQDRARLASIFRTIHTIKGTCGFFGFAKLEKVSHVGENLLSRLRDGVLSLDPERTTALLAMVDAVRAMLKSIEQSGNDGDGDYSALIDSLTRLQEANAAPAPEPTPPRAASPPPPPAPKPEPPPPARSSAPAEPAEAAPAGEAKGASITESNIRVDIGLLDKLMNLVGELVLARNQILQFTATMRDTAFLGTTQRLNLITTELQEGVMKTRMQPIGNVWNRFPRIVRDLAMQCGKQVRLEMEGKDTELDRTIIEAIKDPLTHVIRNSVDHGIEPPEVRTKRGKPAEGTLLLRAYHEGGQVNIEICDDGGGIDGDRVRNKAIEKGLITRDHGARLGERDLVNLVFLPGFSTAEKITNVSGRGVGMDVVKTNIEKIGGTVDIQSRLGHGTTLKIKIPLTLAIIPALVVTCGGDRYAIPQVSLLELVSLEGDKARRGIERIHGAPVYRLRGRLLPLVSLPRELQVEPKAVNDRVNIVVLQADDRQFGLIVDAINDTEEIVVKPLGKHLKGVPLFAGATIMGDGRVALILDVLGIAQKANVIAATRDTGMTEKMTRGAEAESSAQTLLVVEMGARRLAIPLHLVSRLENIPVAEVELADGREVVQYRGQIMPLVRLGDIFPGAAAAESDPLSVVVYAANGRSVGLVVGRIVDVVETSVQVKRATRGTGLFGSAVIQGHVTDLVDLPGVVRFAEPTFAEEAALV